MSARVFFALGTASQVPTRWRNHNGYFIRWDDQGFLLDPGEGTQRQMIFSGISASQITKIFITHFHGDHCLGLAGICQRLSLDLVEHDVELYYPQYGQKYVNNLRNASIFHNRANIIERPFSHEGTIFENKALRIETKKLDHTVESFGYRFQEKNDVRMLPEKLEALGIRGRDIGKLKEQGRIAIEGREVGLEEASEFRKGASLAFLMDTRLCRNAIELSKDADYLISESTYLHSEIADATKNGHLTSKQAAGIAKDAGAGNLILTHFSQRYNSTKEFLAEAKEVFEKTVVVKDGDQVEILRRGAAKEEV